VYESDGDKNKIGARDFINNSLYLPALNKF